MKKRAVHVCECIRGAERNERKRKHTANEKEMK